MFIRSTKHEISHTGTARVNLPIEETFSIGTQPEAIPTKLNMSMLSAAIHPAAESLVNGKLGRGSEIDITVNMGLLNKLGLGKDAMIIDEFKECEKVSMVNTRQDLAGISLVLALKEAKLGAHPITLIDYSVKGQPRLGLANHLVAPAMREVLPSVADKFTGLYTSSIEAIAKQR